jgi:rhodanese-related sulfurtransferase
MVSEPTTLTAALPTISRDELRTRLEHRDVTVVETLPREDYEKAHIPGAINVPLEELKDRAAKLLPDKSAAIVVYCASPT